MKYLIEAIARDIPKEIKNYQLVKRQDIFIPYREIGIECLTKDTAEINIFYETILKLIDIGVCDINEIANILGVDFKVIKEVIVDMITEQYIFTSQNRVTMTNLGRNALKSRQLITIRKKNINQIMVNMITGTIKESEFVTISQTAKYELCLNEVIHITKDFLESNYFGINEIYQRNLIETSIFQVRSATRELYKILDIAYDKLCFVKEELLIYKNNDTDDYEFVISNDIGDGYINAFYNQVKDVVYPGLEKLFERDWEFVRNCKTLELVESDEKKQTDKLKSLLYDCDKITELISCEFTKTRNVIDNKEIEKYFSYHDEIQFEGVIISSRRLKNILNKKIVKQINERIKKKIYIVFDEEEYDIENFLERRFSSLIKKGQMQLIKEEKVNQGYVCFYPNILIEFDEAIAYIFSNPTAILEGKVVFDSNVIKDKLKDIIEKQKIMFFNEKIDGDSITENGMKGINKKYVQKKKIPQRTRRNRKN